eukprot:COSAG02_NODE_1673_length_11384_cov_835.108463_4_plen_83_part_00
MMIVVHMHAMVYTKECSLDNYRLPIFRSIYIVAIVHTISCLFRLIWDDKESSDIKPQAQFHVNERLPATSSQTPRKLENYKG